LFIQWRCRLLFGAVGILAPSPVYMESLASIPKRRA
jgi:hypothetical protein